MIFSRVVFRHGFSSTSQHVVDFAVEAAPKQQLKNLRQLDSGGLYLLR
jgi:hypothetical protein